MYKGRYAIALYDVQDYLVVICDSVNELAKWLDKPLAQVRGAVSEQFRISGGGGYFHLTKQICTMHFIDIKGGD